MIIKDLLKNYYGFFLNPNPTRFVDLGLSVLWADRNINASEETDYGDYFNWNGIEPMQENNKDSLAHSLVNDTVNIKLGGLCRLPTNEELEELMSLPNEWVENYKGSGHNGRIFTGNGNSIFIPAAGGWYYNGFNNNLLDVGSRCSLWSSSLYSGCPDCALTLNFDQNYKGSDIIISSWGCCCGLSVRGVYPK